MAADTSSKETREHFGALMVTHRRLCGITQLQLVQRMQTIQGDGLVKHWEHGRRLPTPRQFSKWAVAVGLTREAELGLLKTLTELKPNQWPQDLWAQDDVYSAYQGWCASWEVSPQTGAKSLLTGRAQSGIPQQ